MDKDDYHALRRRVTEDLKNVFQNALDALDEKLREIDREQEADKEEEEVGIR